jgi:beta-aspartyl-peptidase (threonine type)
VDAVEAAVVALESDDHFNAGKGAVYTASGRHELEASIMTGDKRCAALHWRCCWQRWQYC